MPEDAKPSSEWRAFEPATGTLGVPREQMPQVKAEHRGAMVNFLNARGIEHEQDEVAPESLKPTQAEFSIEKVRRAREFAGSDRSILVSSDGHVLDGHHQWQAAKEDGKPVRVIRLKAPIKELIDAVHEFPSSETAGGAASEAKQESAAPAEATPSAAPASVPAAGSAGVEADGLKEDPPEVLARMNVESPNGRRWEYPYPTRNAPAGLVDGQRAVVDFMNGDTTKEQLIKSLAKTPLLDGQIAGITMRLGDHFVERDIQAVLKAREVAKPEAEKPKKPSVQAAAPAPAADTPMLQQARALSGKSVEVDGKTIPDAGKAVEELSQRLAALKKLADCIA
jgi:hypothetical protein